MDNNGGEVDRVGNGEQEIVVGGLILNAAQKIYQKHDILKMFSRNAIRWFDQGLV